MRIVSAKVIVCSPGRNFVTLKLETEDGVYGLGDATLNGRELAVAAYLTEYVLPLLEGRDARRIEDVWQFLYKGAYWRRGPVTMTAIAAVDTALWDIRGKTLGVPVYQLIGGETRSMTPSRPSAASWRTAIMPFGRSVACLASVTPTVSVPGATTSRLCGISCRSSAGAAHSI